MGEKKQRLLWAGIGAVLVLLAACTPLTSKTGNAPPAGSDQQSVRAPVLPARFQKPTYIVKDLDTPDASADAESEPLKVGADISSIAPMALREVLKILADQKRMTVSWASDVNQNALVDVNIGAEDEFSEAIDNLLRQLDYFHEVKGNTIVVRYNETRKFHVSMPFMNSNYATSVGGNVLGGTTASNQITSQENNFDIWTNIQTNLDRVLEIYSQTEAVAPAATTDAGAATTATPAAGESAAPAPTATARQAAKGFYTIDRPIGLITVTAPRPLLEKITAYIDNLKSEIFRQISIEAKIIEVTLTDETATGIDWANLLNNESATASNTITVSLFGGTGQIFPMGGNVDPRAWDVIESIRVPSSLAGILNLLRQEGEARVLSNPRIVVLNGQPAMISVGKDLTYIAKEETAISDTGVPTTTISTDSIFSGLGLGVVPMISENNEIVLSLTPVISDLQGDSITYIKSSGGTDRIGVPIVNIREMNTVARIKNGEILVVGGFIKETDSTQEKKIRFLGDLPLVGNLFNKKTKSKPKTELVIMLQPKILE